MTYLTFPTIDPAASSWAGSASPQALQAPLTRAYSVAGLVAPQLLDTAVDDAIVAVKAELQESIDSLLADGQSKPEASVKKASVSLAQIHSLDELAQQRHSTAGPRALAAFKTARATAYQADLVPTCEDIADTIIDSVTLLDGAPDVFNLESLVLAGFPAQAWTDLTAALARLSALAGLDGSIYRWINVPTPETPTLYDQWSSRLPDAHQGTVNVAVNAMHEARGREADRKNNTVSADGVKRWGGAMDDDHLIVAIAAGKFSPLTLEFTGDDAEVTRRHLAWAEALKGTKLSRDQFIIQTGKKPIAPAYATDPLSHAFMTGI